MLDEIPLCNLWVESEGEVAKLRQVIDLSTFDQIFVGKRGSRRDVGDSYLRGRFFEYLLSERRASRDLPVQAPDEITSLVQHGMPDIIMSIGTRPVLSIEVTSHVPNFNNVFQRLPKVVRPARQGVPSVIFQKYNKLSATTETTWLVEALHRAAATARTPCMAFLYEDKDAPSAEQTLRDLMRARRDSDLQHLNDFFSMCRAQNDAIKVAYNEPLLIAGIRGHGRRWIALTPTVATVRVGVRRNCDRLEGINCGVNHCSNPAEQQDTYRRIREGTHLTHLNKGKNVKCVWITKGTGGLDPYPGLILATDLLLCHDDSGSRIRRLRVFFPNIPRSFWWWESAKNRLNNRMIQELANGDVVYAGEQL